MRKILIVVFLVGLSFLIASCSNRKDEEGKGLHCFLEPTLYANQMILAYIGCFIRLGMMRSMAMNKW